MEQDSEAMGSSLVEIPSTLDQGINKQRLASAIAARVLPSNTHYGIHRLMIVSTWCFVCRQETGRRGEYGNEVVRMHAKHTACKG